jgi:hypothetical protein
MSVALWFTGFEARVLEDCSATSTSFNPKVYVSGTYAEPLDDRGHLLTVVTRA